MLWVLKGSKGGKTDRYFQWLKRGSQMSCWCC
jgi:hypothetical protein